MKNLKVQKLSVLLMSILFSSFLGLMDNSGMWKAGGPEPQLFSLPRDILAFCLPAIL